MFGFATNCAQGENEFSQFAKRKEADPRYRRFLKGQLVWIRIRKGAGLSPEQNGDSVTDPFEAGYFRPAKVKRGFDSDSSNSTGSVIYKEGGIVREVQIRPEAMLERREILPMGRENLECWGHFDQASLWDLSEASLFHNTRMRFQLGRHFMRVGSGVLLFLNHRFDTDFLALSKLSDRDVDSQLQPRRRSTRQNSESSTFSCDASVAKVAQDAFTRLNESSGRNSQAFVVSGCAGSGTRDITSFLLMRMVQLAKPSDGNWWRKLQAADVLIDQFGGKSCMRWSELQIFYPASKRKWFSKTGSKSSSKSAAGILLGAVFNAFGMDQSRVTSEGRPLLAVFASLGDSQRAEVNRDVPLYLRRKVSRYSGNDIIGTGAAKGTKRKPALEDKRNQEDAKDWGEIVTALIEIGLDQQTVAQLEDLLLGILATGDILTTNSKEIDVMGVSAKQLRSTIETSTFSVRGETFTKTRKPEEQAAVRDGLARRLYGMLFEWLLACINHAIARADTSVAKQAATINMNEIDKEVPVVDHSKLKKSKGTIGVIGILENLSMKEKQGSLEDLYHAYRCEKLHAFFVRDIAVRDAISSDSASHIECPDESVLDLLMGNIESNYKPPAPLLTSAALNQNHASIIPKLSFVNFSAQSSSHGSGTGSSPAVPPVSPANLVRRLSAKFVSTGPHRPNVSKSRARGAAKGNSISTSASLGLLVLIEEEVNLPGGGSSSSLRRRIKRKESEHEYLCSTAQSFTVSHFGGSCPVEYELEHFLESSKANALALNAFDLLGSESACPLVCMLVERNKRLLLQQQAKESCTVRSGLLEKRDVQVLADLDETAGQDSERQLGLEKSLTGYSIACSATKGSDSAYDGEENEHQCQPDNIGNLLRASSNQVSKSVFATLNRAILVLSKTRVEYIVTLAGNKFEDPDLGFDPRYLLEQMRVTGLVDLCNQLASAVHLGSKGSMTPQQFLARYGPLCGNLHCPPKQVGVKVQKLCAFLAGANLIQGRYNISDIGVVTNFKSHVDLEIARQLLRPTAALCIQRMARGFLAKCKYLRCMHALICRELRSAVEGTSRANVESSLIRAKEWNVQHAVVSIARGKLDRFVIEEDLCKNIGIAILSKNLLELYKLLQRAEELAMTGNDFPQVARGIQLLNSLGQVSEEDQNKLRDRFFEIGQELHMLREFHGVASRSQDANTVDSEQDEYETDNGSDTDDDDNDGEEEEDKTINGTSECGKEEQASSDDEEYEWVTDEEDSKSLGDEFDYD